MMLMIKCSIIPTYGVYDTTTNFAQDKLFSGYTTQYLNVLDYDHTTGLHVTQYASSD